MKKYLFIIITLIATSCGQFNSGSRPPADVIPEEKMTTILAQICLVEARFQRRLTIKGASNEEMALENYVGIFNENDITSEEFKTSYNYYTEHPEILEKIYDQVIILLTEQQSVIKSDSTLK